MSNNIFKQLKELEKTDIVDKNWLASSKQTLLKHMKTEPILKIAETEHLPMTSNLLKAIFHPGWKLIPIVLIIVILLAGGLSMVAKSALPGDILYGWKINITERVKAASKLNTESRADYEIMLVGERLGEIAKLSAGGVENARIDIKTIANLNNQIQRAEKQISELETIDPNKALEATIKFKAILNTYQEILKQIEEKAADDLKKQMETTIEITNQTKIKLDDKNSDLVEKTNNTLINAPEQDQKINIESALKQTNEKLTLVTEKVESAASDNELTQKAQEQLEMANKLFSEAKINFENGNYQMTLENIQKIISYLSNAEALIAADKNTNEDVKEIIADVPELKIPVIISIQPSSGPVGTEVILTGQEFTPGETSIYLSNATTSQIIKDIEWINTETIKFIIPEINASDGEEFYLKAVNKDGESNLVVLTLTNAASVAPSSTSTTPSPNQVEK